jgi:integrase
MEMLLGTNGASESVPKESGLPPFVTDHADRHGKHRLRYRRKGAPLHYFIHPFGTHEFWAEYADCQAKVSPASPARIAEKVERIPAGSMSALIAIYYNTPEFKGLATSTQATYRGILNRFRVDFGDLAVTRLSRRDVKEILGDMAERPSAANNLLDRLRTLMTLALDLEWIADDPTMRVKGFRLDSDGFHSWTEEEIARFEARHPTGTKPRLALALLLCTGQRRSDVVLFGRQRIANGRLNIRQKKTGEWVSVPVLKELSREIAAGPKGNMTFLLTEWGRPFSAAGFGNWFRTQCDLAGLPQCSAHGLRKAAARRLAEAGCTNQEIKSITGHRTDKEVARYVEAADRQRLSASAMRKLMKAKKRTAGGQP